MKIIKKISPLFFLALLSLPCYANLNWNETALPNFYKYPACSQEQCGNLGTKVYSTQFPTEPLKWYPELCQNTQKTIYRSTSTRWVSDHLANVYGISFKGLYFNPKLGPKTDANELLSFLTKTVAITVDLSMALYLERTKQVACSIYAGIAMKEPNRNGVSGQDNVE